MILTALGSETYDNAQTALRLKKVKFIYFNNKSNDTILVLTNHLNQNIMESVFSIFSTALLL